MVTIDDGLSVCSAVGYVGWTHSENKEEDEEDDVVCWATIGQQTCDCTTPRAAGADHRTAAKTRQHPLIPQRRRLKRATATEAAVMIAFVALGGGRTNASHRQATAAPPHERLV
jgi:hypothetical protein